MVNTLRKCFLCLFTIIMLTLSLTISTTYSANATYFAKSSFEPVTITGEMNVTTFVSPDCSYEALVSAINVTKASLFMEMYSFSNPFLLDVIGNLSSKGVNVAIILEEQHASYYENQYTYWVAHQL